MFEQGGKPKRSNKNSTYRVREGCGLCGGSGEVGGVPLVERGGGEEACDGLEELLQGLGRRKAEESDPRQLVVADVCGEIEWQRFVFVACVTFRSTFVCVGCVSSERAAAARLPVARLNSSLHWRMRPSMETTAMGTWEDRKISEKSSTISRCSPSSDESDDDSSPPFPPLVPLPPPPPMDETLWWGGGEGGYYNEDRPLLHLQPASNHKCKDAHPTVETHPPTLPPPWEAAAAAPSLSSMSRQLLRWRRCWMYSSQPARMSYLELDRRG